MVPVLAFVIMALGLNIVVGYAGLLDLGYVAFYAAGSYVAGWFASRSSRPHKIRVSLRRDRHHAGQHGRPHLAVAPDRGRRASSPPGSAS